MGVCWSYWTFSQVQRMTGPRRTGRERDIGVGWHHACQAARMRSSESSNTVLLASRVLLCFQGPPKARDFVPFRIQADKSAKVAKSQQRIDDRETMEWHPHLPSSVFDLQTEGTADLIIASFLGAAIRPT